MFLTEYPGFLQFVLVFALYVVYSMAETNSLVSEFCFSAAAKPTTCEYYFIELNK